MSNSSANMYTKTDEPLHNPCLQHMNIEQKGGKLILRNVPSQQRQRSQPDNKVNKPTPTWKDKSSKPSAQFWLKPPDSNYFQSKTPVRTSMKKK